MAIDKDPSIYRDRGTIGSSDELDEYGVWVKTEPQVLRPDAPVAEAEEPSLPDIEDLPDLDVELETASVQAETVHLEPSDSLLPDFSDSDVFSVEDAPAAADAVFEDLGALDAVREPLSEDSFTELSMDDFLEADSSSEKSDDLNLSIDSAPLPPLEELSEDEPLNIDLDFQEPAAENPQTEENVTIDFSVDPEPGAVEGLEDVSDFDDFLSGLSDSSEPTPPSVSVESMEVEAADEALSPDASDFGVDLPAAETIAADSDLDEISVDLSISDGIPESVDDGAALDEHFDDVGALGKDLRDSGTTEKETQRMDLSTELLMRIADELSSIKTEISSLKTELGVLRASAVSAEEPKAEVHESSHGFFDEEDDEKIALTGDELDNILNTADFTEEAGADAGEDMDSGIAIDSGEGDFLSDQPDIIGAEAPAIEKIELEDVKSDQELSELMEMGVRPMTEAPEDTTYLETDEPIAGNDLLATESIDLSEAVIDEPDLSGFTIEEPAIEEPAIESIDIDLDLGEEALHVEEITLPPEPEEEPAELPLDDFKEESFEEVLPEGFIVESEGSVEAFPEAEAAEDFQAMTIDDVLEAEESSESAEAPTAEQAAAEPLPANLKTEIRAVLAYMDQLLESLPESKIEEFAKSEYFDTYKKLFEELGLA
jgi:hypothetical protein